MKEDTFFIPGPCGDTGYQNVRDLSHFEEARNFTEFLWRRYRPYADPNVQREAMDHFLPRFWEMYLAVTFLDHGFQLYRAGNAGPEFYFTSGNQRIWVEAVAPGPGIGNDRVPELQMGAEIARKVPTEKIILRYTNAITEKQTRYRRALKNGVMNELDLYILAINCRGIPDAPYGNALPFFVQALLPFGDLTVPINVKTKEFSEPFYQLREEITKATGSPVSTRAFLDPEFAFVSAVIGSAVDCVNRPPKLGGDFTILHNPSASRPLNPSVCDWCEQLFYRDGALQEVRPG